MKYYGQAGTDKEIHLKYFPNTEKGFFVECGAFDGLLESTCKVFEEFFGWTGINIEPVPELYDKLVKNRPNSRNIKGALSNFKGKNIFIDPIPKGSNDRTKTGWGFVDLTKNTVLDNPSLDYEKFEVECFNFSDIFIENVEIDLFVLDVEGHECEALEGILKISPKYYPKVFCIEVDKTPVDKVTDILKEYYSPDYRIRQDMIYLKK